MSKAKLRAEAINRFVTDAKAVGVWSSLKAATILTGWDTLAGALTPLVGAAPTNVGGAFTAADYDRGGQGLKGNGSSKYLNSNRADSADGQNDHHATVFSTDGDTNSAKYVFGVRNGSSPNVWTLFGRDYWSRSTTSGNPVAAMGVGLYGLSRNSAASFDWMRGGAVQQATNASSSATSGGSHFVYCYNDAGYPNSHSASRLSWYSIGSSVDLSALDTLVTRLMSDLRAIEEDGMDRDALAYIRAVEAQDGSFMVTGVKNAVDRLVKGLKYDKDSNGRSAWDAIGASCLLCGPRTIAGALVPLKGVAPTAYNFVSANYNQETGLVGDGATKYLDSNRPNNADGLTDQHLSVYISSGGSANRAFIGSLMRSPSASVSQLFYQPGLMTGNINAIDNTSTSYAGAASFAGVSRSGLDTSVRAGSATVTQSVATVGYHSYNHHVFARNDAESSFPFHSDARLAFYSIGASLSLSSLDSRITKYVNDVAAAIP